MASKKYFRAEECRQTSQKHALRRKRRQQMLRLFESRTHLQSLDRALAQAHELPLRSGYRQRRIGVLIESINN